jgi:galactokinase
MTGLAARFGRTPEVTAHAPGRVNLIGEHTDYNDGFVLPAVIPQTTEVELAARSDDRVRAASADVDGRDPESYRLGEERRREAWIDYVQGVTSVLREHGAALGGFDVWFTTEIPIGGGVSSSAAFQVALLRALRERFRLVLDDVEIARLAQRSENGFVGARVGIMDPLASSLGREGRALFVDTRSLECRHVPIPRDMQIVAVDSGVSHRLAGGEYNQRRAECEQACARLGIASLRDLTMEDLDRIAAMPDTLARRARHVVTENARVLAAVAALEQDRPDELGRLFDDSHASLRDDYEVSIEAVDHLAGALHAQPGVWGSRLTGGGFGGAVIAVARPETAAAAARNAAAVYERETGNHPSIVLPYEPPRDRDRATRTHRQQNGTADPGTPREPTMPVMKPPPGP